MAVVDQEIVLFEDTIKNNIRMWDESIEDFEVILAARDARIYDDIMAREGGFNGKLTENGKDLSGGQRQRVGIAMANATPACRDAADYVTLHHDEDGLAWAIYNILKI